MICDNLSPEDVLVLRGTSRLIARNFIVVEREAPPRSGRKLRGKTWDVVLIAGTFGGVSAWDCGTFGSERAAVKAADEFRCGRAVPACRPIRSPMELGT